MSPAKPKLRDGVMKRGTTWFYVIRVKDPETGVSKPPWVGGYATEQDAKAARDEVRVTARRGEYIDRPHPAAPVSAEERGAAAWARRAPAVLEGGGSARQQRRMPRPPPAAATG
jgi:hypothetical protein